MKKRLLISLMVAGLMILGGCSGLGQKKNPSDTAKEKESASTQENSATKEIFAMDTYMTLTAYGSKADNAVAAAVKEIQRLDKLLSTNTSTSEIAKINADDGGTVSQDTAYLIEKSIQFYKETEGAYDITVYPIVKGWGFTTGDYKVLSDSQIKPLLQLVGTDKLVLDKKASQVSFKKKGMQIDLGTIAKGYTSERIMNIFKSYEVKSGMVSLGGNVQVLGTKPDGSSWRVAIEQPEKNASATSYIGVLETKDKAVTTAGGYERYFEKNGKTYHHIFDPSTGKPAESGLISVTVICDDGTDADGLDTPLFVMGKKKAVSFWKKHKKEFDMILIDNKKKIYVTEGISEAFSSDSGFQVIGG